MSYSLSCFAAIKGELGGRYTSQTMRSMIVIGFSALINGHKAAVSDKSAVGPKGLLKGYQVLYRIKKKFQNILAVLPEVKVQSNFGQYCPNIWQQIYQARLMIRSL